MLPERRRWQPTLDWIELVTVPSGDSQRWEQGGLPRAASDAVIVNLANLAPVAAKRQILLLHDAQFLFPDSDTAFERFGGLPKSMIAIRSASPVG